MEICPQKEGGPARDRNPQLRGCSGMGKGLAVGAGYPRLLPGLESLRDAPSRAPPETPLNLVAPVLAAAISAALDQILRGAGDRVIGLAEGRNASITIVIDATCEPYLRHPLGVAHGARPGAAHLLGVLQPRSMITSALSSSCSQ